MKFKGKKAIMAAALSAIVAASSFGTAITASATDTYVVLTGKEETIGGHGSISVTKVRASVGESITVTVTPNTGSRIYYFVVKHETNMDNGTKLYEVYPNSTTTLTYTFTMPGYNVRVRAAFEPIPTPDPTPTPTPDPTPDPTPNPNPTPDPSPTWKRGDVNLDGYVNAKDATAVLKHVVGLEKLTGQSLINADVNGDGYINAKDATEILKIVIGMA